MDVSHKAELIEKSGSSSSKVDMIRTLMPAFQELSEIFSVDIKVSCPEGFLDPSPYGGGSVYFHVDSYPLDVAEATSTAQSIFGFKPRVPIPIKGLRGKSMLSLVYKGSLLTDVSSPEKNSIGCILGSNIFIYPEVLTSSSWDDESRVRLLKAISFWLMPRAIANISSESAKDKIGKGLTALRAKYRETYATSFPVRKTEIRDGVKNFILLACSELVSKTEEKIKDAGQTIESLSVQYWSHLGELHKKRSQLEATLQNIRSRDFGKEFEALMIMESIETVRIVNDDFLQVKLSPIYQIPEADYKSNNPKKYDIGEYVLLIGSKSEAGLSRSDIKFHQSRYVGPFRSKFINTDGHATCFGTALNPQIESLLERLDTVPLVHLILTFMKKESSIPSKRNSWDESIQPSPDSYKDENEREDEKQKFIKLISEKVLQINTKRLQNGIKELEGKIASVRENLLRDRKVLTEEEDFLDRLNEILYSDLDREREAEKLLEDKSIFWIDFFGDQMRIYFHCPEMEGEENYSSEDFLLILHKDTFPELMIPMRKRILQPVFLNNKNQDDKEDMAESEMLMKNLQSGKISEIIRTAKEKILAGTYNPKNKTGEGASDE